MSKIPYNERVIIEILYETRPHPNIVAFYDIHPTHVDMELLDTENIDKKKQKNTHKNRFKLIIDYSFYIILGYG